MVRWLKRMSFVSKLLVVLMSVHMIHNTRAVTQCTRVDMCSCTTKEGKLVDLKPLSHNPPLQAESVGFNYKWNPCNDFQYETVTAGCMKVSKAGGSITTIGFNTDRTTSTSVDFNGNPVFEMDDKNFPPASYAKVTCACDEKSGDATLTFTGESTGTVTIVSFTLTAPHCCPGYLPPAATTLGLSVGAVLTIVFFTVLVCYFVFGTVFQVTIRKSQGKERIPNVEFWSALPGLIKDGFMFTFRMGTRTGYSKL